MEELEYLTGIELVDEHELVTLEGETTEGCVETGENVAEAKGEWDREVALLGIAVD